MVIIFMLKLYGPTGFPQGGKLGKHGGFHLGLSRPETVYKYTLEAGNSILKDRKS